MSGTVHYRWLDHPKLFDELGAPALIKYRPGRILVHADGREFQHNPELIHQLDQLSDDLVAPYRLLELDEPLPAPSLSCQIHRVRRVAGGRLVASEIVDTVVHVEILKAAMSGDLTAALSALGTSVGHYLSPT